MSKENYSTELAITVFTYKRVLIKTFVTAMRDLAFSDPRLRAKEPYHYFASPGFERKSQMPSFERKSHMPKQECHTSQLGHVESLVQLHGGGHGAKFPLRRDKSFIKTCCSQNLPLPFFRFLTWVFFGPGGGVIYVPPS